MRKLAIVGAESSGKTTLAQDLAQALGAPWLPEYARDYLAGRSGGGYTLEDVVAIAESQRAGEAMPARWRGPPGGDWLVCDTNALVCKVWAEVRYGHCPPAIMAAWPAADYALHVLPRPDMPWQPDPLREHPAQREVLFECYRAALEAAAVPYLIVAGSPVERVASVVAALP